MGTINTSNMHTTVDTALSREQDIVFRTISSINSNYIEEFIRLWEVSCLRFTKLLRLWEIKAKEPPYRNGSSKKGSSLLTREKNTLLGYIIEEQH